MELEVVALYVNVSRQLAEERDSIEKRQHQPDDYQDNPRENDDLTKLCHAISLLSFIGLFLLYYCYY